MQGIEKLNGHTVETELGALLDRLIVGELGLHELTPALAGLVTYGFECGRGSQDPELADLRRQLARAEHERDLYFARLHNPGRRLHETIQDRLDTAARAIEAQGLPTSEAKFFERVLNHAIDIKAPSSRAA